MPNRFFSLLPVALLTAALSASSPAADEAADGAAETAETNEALPELGDSAAQVLSPKQEKQLGQQFLRRLLRHPDYIGDPHLNRYLEQLGAAVAAPAAMREPPMLHLVDDSALNAFAVPGGHIVLHSGLILAAEDEHELAAVVGHETAHVSQRHLPRMLAKAQASQFPAAAALLASLLVGGQAGLIGFTVANAALLSNQLAYTRDFEREADAIGIKLLAQAGFDPSALVRFFDKLDDGGAPEFLRTHPLSYARIAEAESRAAAYPPQIYTSARAFYLAQAKIRALYGGRAAEVVEYFENAAAATGDARDAALYGLALAHKKQHRFAEAAATLAPLLAAHPHEVAFQLARADIDLASGNPAAAAARHQRLVEAHPQRPYLTRYLAASLIESGDPAAAKRVIRRQLRRHKDMFVFYPLLSRSNVKLGLQAEAHQANAEFYAALGEYNAAVSSLKLALREADAGGYLHHSITARLSQIEEIIKQQQGF